MAGNVLNDGTNAYVYDAEGRICAVENLLSTSVTAYLYDASGARVAKGTPTAATLPLTPAACNLATNGFQLTNMYLLDAGGNQVTELNTNTGTMAWAHSNVWAGSHLNATYDLDSSTLAPALHFHLSDPLGTRRVQTDPFGNMESYFWSLPFGDGFTPMYTAANTADDATENHFTGKEWDSESGNDYFEARYYSSLMGRFMSPDWSDGPLNVPFADFTDPQTLNLYQYTRNNPLIRTDPDGHCDAGGEHHNAVWCWLHDHHLFGVETAAERQADQVKEARGFIAAIGFDAIKVNGHWQPSSSSSDSDIASWWKDYDENYRQLLNEGMTAAGAMGFLGGAGGGGSGRLTNAQVNDLAKWSGMEPVKDPPFDSHGQKVFKIGNRYFTPDVDSHIGGVWKEFDRQGNRVGTLDVNLNRIGK